MTMTERKPSALPTSASPMPVLPAVPSTMTPPGRSSILNRLAGIHEFGLAQNRATGRGGHAFEFD
jgi:hypothetical protein